MRPSNTFARLYLILALVLVLTIAGLSGTGAVRTAAQEATQTATNEAGGGDDSGFMLMEGLCPPGYVQQIAGEILNAGATPEGGSAEGTPDGGMMGTPEGGMMTPEATMDGGMMGTPEGGMMATQEGGMMATAEGTMAAAGTQMCVLSILTGLEPAPSPQDTDGVGLVAISLDANTGEVCFDVLVEGITLPAAASHIHQGNRGEEGPVVVPAPGAPDAEGKLMGCTSGVDTAIIQGIMSNPSGYYYNVHTSDFPKGAIRGQLGSDGLD